LAEMTDRDVAYDILYAEKMGAECYLFGLLEAATPRCREVFHRLHDDCLREQWRVWQFLHERNEYRVSAASRSEIEGVRRRMAELAGNHGAAAPAWGGSRWDAAHAEEGYGGSWGGRASDRDDYGAARGGRSASGARDAGWGADASRQPATHRY
jgi:hypothetical protein